MIKSTVTAELVRLTKRSCSGNAGFRLCRPQFGLKDFRFSFALYNQLHSAPTIGTAHAFLQKQRTTNWSPANTLRTKPSSSATLDSTQRRLSLQPSVKDTYPHLQASPSRVQSLCIRPARTLSSNRRRSSNHFVYREDLVAAATSAITAD